MTFKVGGGTVTKSMIGTVTVLAGLVNGVEKTIEVEYVPGARFAKDGFIEKRKVAGDEPVRTEMPGKSIPNQDGRFNPPPRELSPKMVVPTGVEAPICTV